MNVLFYLVPKSSVVYLYDDNTVAEAMQVMGKHRYTSVPLISRDGAYKGSLREGDILWGLKERENISDEILERIQVRQLKWLRDNEPVNIGCTMEELISASMNQNFIPVIDDDGIFIGIVTRKSIISYCLEKNR